MAAMLISWEHNSWQVHCQRANEICIFTMNIGNLAPKFVMTSATKFTAKFQSRLIMAEASSASESELGSWMTEFEDQLDPEHYKQVYDTLKANGFTSHVKLKLVHEDLLNIMFNEVLPLGTQNIFVTSASYFERRVPTCYKT